MEKPLTMTRPAVGTISPVSSLIMVDLPDPEGPTKKTKSPSSIVNEMPFRASVPLSYTFLTSISRIIYSSQFSETRMLPRKKLQNGYMLHYTVFSRILQQEKYEKSVNCREVSRSPSVPSPRKQPPTDALPDNCPYGVKTGRHRAMVSP